MRFDDLREGKDAIDQRLEIATLHVVENVFLAFGFQLRNGKYFAQRVALNR